MSMNRDISRKITMRMLQCTIPFFGVYLHPPKNCYSNSLNIIFYCTYLVFSNTARKNISNEHNVFFFNWFMDW